MKNVEQFSFGLAKTIQCMTLQLSASQRVLWRQAEVGSVPLLYRDSADLSE